MMVGHRTVGLLLLTTIKAWVCLQISVALAKRKKQRRKSCAFAWAINSQLDEVQLLSRERHLCFALKIFKRRIAPPEAVRCLWRCWRSPRARYSFTFTPQVAMRQSTRQNHPENPTVRRKMCLHTYSDASLWLHALKSKKTNFFLGDLLENRVDTTYIHKEWSKIVTFWCKWKKKNESLQKPNPSYRYVPSFGINES